MKLPKSNFYNKYSCRAGTTTFSSKILEKILCIIFWKLKKVNLTKLKTFSTLYRYILTKNSVPFSYCPHPPRT